MENLQKANGMKRQCRTTVEDIPDMDEGEIQQLGHLGDSRRCDHILCDCHLELPDLLEITLIEADMDDDLDDGENDSDDEEEHVDEPEIRELTELEIFSAQLHEAQEIARAVECEKAANSNRLKRYFGSSEWSKQ